MASSPFATSPVDESKSAPSASPLASDSSQSFDAIAERIISRMITGCTLSEEIQCWIFSEDSTQLSSAAECALSAGVYPLEPEYYLDSCGVDKSLSLQKKVEITTQLPRDVAQREECDEFLEWLIDARYWTANDCRTSPELAWFKDRWPEIVNDGAASACVVDELWNVERDLVYDAFRRSPSARPVSFLVWMVMRECSFGKGPVEEMMQSSVKLTKEMRKRALAEEVARGRAKEKAEWNKRQKVAR